MIIQLLRNTARLPATFLLGALSVALVPGSLHGEETALPEPRAANVDWVMDGEDMVISYDLIGDSLAVYDVSVSLLRTGDPDFQLVPVRAYGDIGEGKFAGRARSIRWRIQEELGRLPEGDDFVVEVTVEDLDDLPWFLVVVGVAVGGATIYSFVQNGEDADPPPILELPGPPARP